jgi:hypothetical protein
LIAIGACRREEPPAPDVVAKIGESPVHYADFEGYLARAVGDGGGSVLVSDVLSGLFDQFLDEELLVRLAVDRGLIHGGSEKGGAPKAADDERDRRQAVERLLETSLAAAAPEVEVVAYYRAHRQEFARPERVRLRQILTEDRASAERALKAIAAGSDFGEVARQMSRDPSAAAGGDQGELARSDLPPAFAEVIFALQPGEVSRVVPADYGFHVFQVTARLPAEVVPLEQARPEIAERLRRQRADRRLRELVAEARKRYHVTLFARNLPFNYKGSYDHDPISPDP